MDLNLDVDKIWKSLGTWGRFQRFQLLIIFLDGMASAFHLLSSAVIAYRPPYSCREAELNCSTFTDGCGNESLYVKYDKCHMDIYKNGTNQTFIKTEECVNGYKYSVHKDITFVTEWDLVCDNAEIAEFTQTLLIIGQATGAAIFTQFADRFGRKPVHIVAHVGIFILALGMAFVPNLTVFAILRYLVGTFQQGIVMTNAVMGLEILPRDSRFMAHVLFGCSWTTGAILLAPLGYLYRNTSWRYFQMTLACYSAYSLILYWIMEESLRWLIANGKAKEAERIIRKAARWNKVNFDSVIKQSELSKEMTELSIIEATDSDHTKDKLNNGVSEGNTLISEELDSEKLSKINREDKVVVKRYTFFTILKNRKLLRNSLILWYTWIVDSMTYYGISLFATSLSGNRFLNFFLVEIVEYPAELTEFFLLNRIGRKKTVIFFHAVSAVALITATILVTFADGNTSLLAASVFFTLLGKYGSTGSFWSLFIYTPELFPTNLRNVGIGVSSTVSRLGGMLAPFAGPLAQRVPWAPGAIFGTLCLFVTILCTALPETRKFELPQTLEEMEKWSKENNKHMKKKNKNNETNN